jgi:hypothetical protein
VASYLVFLTLTLLSGPIQECRPFVAEALAGCIKMHPGTREAETARLLLRTLNRRWPYPWSGANPPPRPRRVTELPAAPGPVQEGPLARPGGGRRGLVDTGAQPQEAARAGAAPRPGPPAGRGPVETLPVEGLGPYLTCRPAASASWRVR